MTERQERRTPGVHRVAVARLVDICGRDLSVPAFEAESVELSGRGMHVKTPYLPPLGAPLVCRLEEGGQEIVVEGVVAWQRDHEGGGEFGVQFTALDSGSVEALRGLCGLEGPATLEAKKEETEEPPKASADAPPGLPVKLHIDGLGAPMKARVKAGFARKLQVGSNLEFLKVGRGLEVEDVEHGARRGARIDAVSIAIDPQTQVPQLVVMLRYAGEDTTPEPSVVDDDEEEAMLSVGAPLSEIHAASEAAPPVSMDDEDDDEDDRPASRDDHDEAAAFRGRVDVMAVGMSRAAKRASDQLGVFGSAAADGIGKWVKLGSAKVVALAKQRGAPPKRRSTAPAPVSSGPETRRLRPQNATAEDETGFARKKKKIVAAAVAGSALTLAIGALALSGHAKAPQAAAPATPPQGDALAAAPPPVTAPSMPAPTAVAAAPSMPMPMNAALPGASTPGVAMPPPGAPPGQRSTVVANVPLFGPTPMATLEPAPLGPAPDAITAVPASGITAAPPEERMDDDKPEAADESFGSDKKGSAKDKDEKSPEDLAASVKPFAQGTMHLPLVYRLKLDKPGAALEGKKEASGFSVFIPGRKVEGSGVSISKRDDRISEVKTKNDAHGAHVTFVFRSKVPSYKVRLKKSGIEFFVSSPTSAK